MGLVNRALVLLSLVLLADPFQAAASLIAEDLTPGSGDHLLTLDTNTGLEWLNLTLTEGHSVNDLVAGFGGFLAAGFRYATSAEVTTLFSDAGGFQYTDGTPGLFGPANNFIALLGATHSLPNDTDETADGLYGLNEPGAGLAYIAQVYRRTTLTQGGYFDLGIRVVDFNANSQTVGLSFGSFLVTAVPEPGTSLLVMVGVLSLAVNRRRYGVSRK